MSKRSRSSSPLADPGMVVDRSYSPETVAHTVSVISSEESDSISTWSADSSLIPGSMRIRIGSFVYIRMAMNAFEACWRLWISMAYDMYVRSMYDHYLVARYGTDNESVYAITTLTGDINWDIV